MYTNTIKIEYVLYKICTALPTPTENKSYLVLLSLMV